MKLIITAPRGKMASLIVAEAAARDDVEIVAGIGPKGRDYIGKDIGEVAMTGKTVGAPVVDDLESVIDSADVVCDFSKVELGMEVLDACWARICFLISTAAGLYSALSRSSIVIAPAGQAGRQSPKPSQKSSRKRCAFPFSITIAFSWQAEAHKPQPVHFSSSIFTIFLIIIHLASSVLRFYFIIRWAERMLLKQQNSNKLKI